MNEINWTRPVELISTGERLTVLQTDGPEPYPVVARGGEVAYTFTRDGRSVADRPAVVRNAPESPRRWWVLISDTTYSVAYRPNFQPTGCHEVIELTPAVREALEAKGLLK